MKSRSTGYSSDSEQTKQQDLSVLRKPILTALHGFLEAKRAYENGTEEIRRLLSRECDIMYECKVCRNVFRSLTNFISHKRVYCRSAHTNLMNFNSNNNGFIDHDISTIIQAEQDYISTKSSTSTKKNISTTVSSNGSTITLTNSGTVDPSTSLPSSSSSANNNKNNENSNKDLSSIIERLLKREQANRLLKLSDFYEQVSSKLAQDEILRKKHILQLDRVPNSDVAVYQTIKSHPVNASNNDNIKKEIIEINDMLLKENTVLGPDGKVIEPVATSALKTVLENSSTGFTRDQIKEVDEKKSKQTENNSKSKMETNDTRAEDTTAPDKGEEVSCNLCNNKFSTEKTLKLHIQSKHITSTFVYQCPSCTLTFLQPGSVIRHLNNDHKKSLRRIRLMRESIYRKRVRLDEIPVKGPSRELARLQIDKDRLLQQQKKENENANWLDNIDQRLTSAPTCNYCGKTFERKAVLATHLNSCSMKNKTTLNLRKNAGNGNTTEPLNTNGSSQSATGGAPHTTILHAAQYTKTDNVNASGSTPSDSSSQQNSKTTSTSINGNKVISIDLTDDDAQMANSGNKSTGAHSGRGRRKKAPKILIKNDNPDMVFISEGLWNVDEKTEDLSLKTVSLDDLTNTNTNTSSSTTSRSNRNNPDRESDGDGDGEEDEEECEECENAHAVMARSNDRRRHNKNASNSRSNTMAVTTTTLGMKIYSKDVYFFCKICEKRFDAISNLRRHISMFHYRRRKFGCKICDYRAFRKYDVINHLNSVHSIYGDKEVALEFIVTKEEKVERSDDIDEDVLMSENSIFSDALKQQKQTQQGQEEEQTEPQQKQQSQQNQSNSGEKRKRGRNARAPKVGTTENSGTNENKFTRTSSNISICSNGEESPNASGNTASVSRRPIRNRIKPVNKDFVYDLSNLLKKDMILSDTSNIAAPVRSQKRRNTTNTTFSPLATVTNSPAEEIQNTNLSAEDTNRITIQASSTTITEINGDDTNASMIAASYVSSENGKTPDAIKVAIKGAALAMAQAAVAQYSACFNKPPEIPLERPIIPSRLINTNRNSEPAPSYDFTDNSSPIFSNSPFEDSEIRSKLLRRISEDSVIQALTKRRRIDSNGGGSFGSSSLDSASSLLRRKLDLCLNGSVEATGDVQINESKSCENLSSIIIKEDGTKNATTNGDIPKPTSTSTPTQKDDKITVLCPTEKEFQEYLIVNKLTEPVRKVSVTSYVDPIINEIIPTKSDSSSKGDNANNKGVAQNSSGEQEEVSVSTTSSSTPTKRKTLLQRMAENKSKRLQQSLLRSALEDK